MALHRRFARGAERVVRDVVDGADDPAVVAPTIMTNVEDVARRACSRLPKQVRSPERA